LVAADVGPDRRQAEVLDMDRRVEGEGTGFRDPAGAGPRLALVFRFEDREAVDVEVVDYITTDGKEQM